LGEQLARIHAINPAAALSFLPAPHPDLSPALDTLIQIRAILTRLGVYNPAFAFGLRWAETRLPESAETVLLHGDYRMGNFIVGPDGLRGIVDWEFARMGDPHEELAWPCVRGWRFGDSAQRLGGIARREPFLQAYEAASGRSINRRSVDFWEVVGNLRWAALSLAQAERHRSGRDRSVELAALGRRSAEMQLEMLRLIDDLG
jgi:aminoglycoside phosphotransferase (APT) family kinase protein